MTYTVVWLFSAQRMLADVWTAAPDRNAVTAASYRVDQKLAANPLDCGESREQNERLMFEPPLQVLFRVYAGQQRVEVISVAADRH